MKQNSLIFGFDPLCGWCFGFIPAMRALSEARPDIQVELVLGGLVTGDRVGPYAAMHDYISSASQRMSLITGQYLSDSFFNNILSRPDILSSSIKPSIVIHAVRKQYPSRALDFALAVQEAHFLRGQDLNQPATFLALFEEMELNLAMPKLQTDSVEKAAVEAEFEYAASQGIVSFPAIIAIDNVSAAPTIIPTEYNPEKFVKVIDRTFPRRR